jgi:hypothetical protein
MVTGHFCYQAAEAIRHRWGLYFSKPEISEERRS